LSATEYDVYKLLKEDGTQSAEEIAEKIGKKSRTVFRMFDALKEKGFVERAGGANGGRWVVLK